VIIGKKSNFDEKVAVKKVRKPNKKDKKNRVLINSNMKPSVTKPPLDQSKEQKRLAERESNWNERFMMDTHITGTQGTKKNELDNV